MFFMKNFVFRTLLLAGVILGLIFSVVMAEEAKPLQDKFDTIVSPVMDARIVKGQNLVYCVTFQLAWNELCGRILKGEAKLADMPALAVALNKNIKAAVPPVLTGSNHIVMSGMGKDKIVEKINDRISFSFHGMLEPVNQTVGDEDVYIYAALIRNFSFVTEYDDILPERRLKFINSFVKFFGLSEFQDRPGKMAELKKQTQILKYDEKTGEFILRMKSDPLGDELVLACVKPSDTLKKTYDRVALTASRAKTEKLEEGDSLAIPEIEFNIKESFDSLAGKRLQNKGFSTYSIGGAIQAVSFHLDKTGAKLKSKAEILAYANGKSHKYRQLIFNKPFMIYMKESKAKAPYFIMWVENSRLMKVYE
jgi:hypothetical protein